VSLEQALLELQELAEQLRRDCPWDREQTAATIAPHTVEEAYEVSDAVHAGDPEKLVDELGDLLYQVYFLALLLEEEGAGDLEQVARSIHDKLVRRHPHVFESPTELRSPGEVKHRWERLKVEEGREGVFHDVPGGLPALLYARKVQKRAAAVGFEFPDLSSRLVRLEEELEELRAEIRRTGAPPAETQPDQHVEDELGDVLFLTVNVAMRLNVDPELALRRTTQKFVSRVERAVAIAGEHGEDWAELDLERQDRYYELAKERT
jgi:nucleoside triphosphate diphosphatase